MLTPFLSLFLSACLTSIWSSNLHNNQYFSFAKDVQHAYHVKISLPLSIFNLFASLNLSSTLHVSLLVSLLFILKLLLSDCKVIMWILSILSCIRYTLLPTVHSIMRGSWHLLWVGEGRAPLTSRKMKQTRQRQAVCISSLVVSQCRPFRLITIWLLLPYLQTLFS